MANAAWVSIELNKALRYKVMFPVYIFQRKNANTIYVEKVFCYNRKNWPKRLPVCETGHVMQKIEKEVAFVSFCV